jgi:uncharacterized OB-fold protein
MYEKPLPVVDADSAPYWDALREHRLVLKRCNECNRFHFFPRAICPHCYSDSLEWAQVSGFGELYTYTVARRPAGPAFKPDAPYIVALVTLDEGPRMMTNLINIAPADVRIGARVAVSYDDVTDKITLPKFTLLEAEIPHGTTGK